ncbi:MAG: hypothetical protein GF320_07480 [Armatimonadia bacterium]|nr:hypothetical protein [Armatimonadia bacterium]
MRKPTIPMTGMIILSLTLVATAWAQAPLVMNAAGPDGPEQPALEINVRMGEDGAEALERLLMRHGRAEGEVQAYGPLVNISFRDAAAAIRFLQAVSAEIDSLDEPDEGWVRVPIAQADPRHVRARIGAETIPAGEPIELRCTMDPPQLLLRGPEDAVDYWARQANRLDVPPPLRPSPEAVVRMYLEHWLIVPQDRVTPDFEGMYQFVVSDDPINLAEFSLIVSRAVINRPRPMQVGPESPDRFVPPPLDQTLTGYTGWLNPEISAVYEANVDMDRGLAVVPYSLAWFSESRGTNWSIAPPSHSELLEARQGATASERAHGYMRQNPLDNQGIPATNARGQVFPDSLHRGYALVVRGRDGLWRLPMAYDAERRTWLTPLSSTLAEREAPHLLPQPQAPELP